MSDHIYACDVCRTEFRKRAPNQRLCGAIECSRRARRDRKYPETDRVYRSYSSYRKDEGGRTCTQCHDYKPWDQFYRVKKNRTGYSAVCKPCDRQNSATRRAYLSAVSTDDDRETLRLRRQANIYGISVDELMRLEAIPNCELCGAPVGAGTGKRAIDHCHESGRIRGVTCTACNVALGRLGDSVEGLERAIEYLLRRVDLLREN